MWKHPCSRRRGGIAGGETGKCRSAIRCKLKGHSLLAVARETCVLWTKKCPFLIGWAGVSSLNGWMWLTVKSVNGPHTSLQIHNRRNFSEWPKEGWAADYRGGDFHWMQMRNHKGKEMQNEIYQFHQDRTFYIVIKLIMQLRHRSPRQTKNIEKMLLDMVRLVLLFFLFFWFAETCLMKCVFNDEKHCGVCP